MEPKKKIPKARLWISYILQAIIVIMFLMGAIMNLLQTEQAVAGATALGFPAACVPYLGLVLLLGTVLYIFPVTSGWGAILLTGWLGGAVAIHVLNGDPAFNVVFPVIFGIVMWGALWLRQEKVQKLVSLK